MNCNVWNGKCKTVAITAETSSVNSKNLINNSLSVSSMVWGLNYNKCRGYLTSALMQTSCEAQPAFCSVGTCTLSWG
jgi:hypothetical protein